MVNKLVIMVLVAFTLLIQPAQSKTDAEVGAMASDLFTNILQVHNVCQHNSFIYLKDTTLSPYQKRYLINEMKTDCYDKEEELIQQFKLEIQE